MGKETCETCKFWKKFDDHLNECRRHSPVAPINKFEGRLFPRTWSNEWCGDYGRKVDD